MLKALVRQVQEPCNIEFEKFLAHQGTMLCVAGAANLQQGGIGGVCF